MEYSQDTADLIERMCRNVERKDFVLDKEKAEECLLKTYDLFDLERPKNIVWCVDVFSTTFSRTAEPPRTARSARSARATRATWAAWYAEPPLSARSARAARATRAAWYAEPPRSAASTRAARAAWAAWYAWFAASAQAAWADWGTRAAASAALDYDFEYFILWYEYSKNLDDAFPLNENGIIYLEYCELLMQAKEYGMGYRVEQGDTLYCAPTPIVLIDNNNRFHSEEAPAIRWKGGKEFYFLHGVKFNKKLWEKVLSKSLSFKQIIRIDNIEQRMIALKYMDVDELLQGANALKLDETERGNELFVVPKESDLFDEATYFLRYSCPSTGRVYLKGVRPEYGKSHDADLCQASTFQYPDWTGKGLEWRDCTKEMYASLSLES